jgi:hypothetical protein
MQISSRELFTAMHGLGFAALLLLAFSGALIELYRFRSPDGFSAPTARDLKFMRGYLIVMAVLAWCTVLSGAYIVYPWYRAKPPAGITNLAGYPQRSLLANPATAGWHTLGMEWKEHVAWFVPIIMTMIAYVHITYGSDLSKHQRVRKAVFAFGIAAFVVAGIAGAFGAFINKHAPVQGGSIIRLMK